MDILESCTLCPRKCGINRYKGKGFCGEGAEIRIARADLHFWEEPCISGKNGSGTVFFSGCCLKCCFCQNYEISAEGKGFVISQNELADAFLMLQDKGANNINLVSATHFVPQIIKALDIAGDRLKIPVVYNCGGYECLETLEMLRGRVSIFLPDLKYFDTALSKDFSKADDYFENTSRAIKKMFELVGKPVFNDNGILQSGVIVRHLVLPNHRKDSLKVIEWLKDNFSSDEILVSVMSQFTPMYKAFEHKDLSRKTSTFEYNCVVDALTDAGFNGYFQKKTSAKEEYVPQFFEQKYF